MTSLLHRQTPVGYSPLGPLGRRGQEGEGFGCRVYGLPPSYGTPAALARDGHRGDHATLGTPCARRSDTPRSVRSTGATVCTMEERHLGKCVPAYHLSRSGVDVLPSLRSCCAPATSRDSSSMLGAAYLLAKSAVQMARIASSSPRPRGRPRSACWRNTSACRRAVIAAKTEAEVTGAERRQDYESSPVAMFPRRSIAVFRLDWIHFPDRLEAFGEKRTRQTASLKRHDLGREGGAAPYQDEVRSPEPCLAEAALPLASPSLVLVPANENGSSPSFSVHYTDRESLLNCSTA
jgi:hypothetical protein